MSSRQAARQSTRVTVHRALTDTLRQLVYDQRLWQIARDRAWPRRSRGQRWQAGWAIQLAARWEARWRAPVLGCLFLATLLLAVWAAEAWAGCLTRLLRLAAAPRLSPEDRADLVEPLRLGDWALLLYLAFAILWATSGG